MKPFAQSDVLPLRKLTDEVRNLALLLAYGAGFVAHAINVEAIEKAAKELKEAVDKILELVGEEE